MKSALKYFKGTCENIEKEGLTKNEKVITSPQGAKVSLNDGREVINMCANNWASKYIKQNLTVWEREMEKCMIIIRV